MLLTRRFSYLTLANIIHLIVFTAQLGYSKNIKNTGLEPINNTHEVGKKSFNENGPQCNCSCGLSNSNNFTPRIVNGTKTTKNQFPWMVNLDIGTRIAEEFVSLYSCGGSLINDRYVLTAAHCFTDLTSPKVVANFSLQNRCTNENTVSRNVIEIIISELFNTTTFENDIALVKLNESVPITDHTIRPICLPPDTDFYSSDDMVTAIGWGVQSEGSQDSSCELMQVELPVFDNEECARIYKHFYKPINDKMICAGYKEGGKDACQGDSGGPLIKLMDDGRYSIAGIVSFGQGCARQNIPGVFTRVNKYTRFIRENTKDGCFCSQ